MTFDPGLLLMDEKTSLTLELCTCCANVWQSACVYMFTLYLVINKQTVKGYMSGMFLVILKSVRSKGTGLNVTIVRKT